jgi:hypothetical protein
MWNKYWPHFRSFLILTHLVAICLKAIPAPEGGMNKNDWKNPTVQAEFKTWTAHFNAIGVNIEQSELEGKLWTLAQQYMSIRKKILKPFRPYYRHFGADQNWRLFVAPHMYPSTLHLDLYIDGVWVPAYQPFSEYKWQESLIETSRFRPAIFRYSWKRYKKHYRTMGIYFAKKAAEDFPDATKLRTRWWRKLSPSPQQILDDLQPEGQWRLVNHFDLEDYR